eukprot:gene302-1636_t
MALKLQAPRKKSFALNKPRRLPESTDMSATQVEATEEQHEPLPNEPQPIAEPGANAAASWWPQPPPQPK